MKLQSTSQMESFYNLAIETNDDWQFFSYLYNFARILDTEPKFEGMFEMLKKDRNNDYSKIDKLAIKAKKEITTTHVSLKKYINESNNSDSRITNKLSFYDKTLTGEYRSSHGELADLYEHTWYPMMLLIENGNEEDLSFTKKYCKFDKDKRIELWTFSPSFTKRELLISGFMTIEKTRPWYCWNKIYWAYKAIDDRDNKIFRKLLKDNGMFEAINWSGFKNEITGIISRLKRHVGKPTEFIIDDYKYYLTICYPYFYDLLETKSVASNDKHTGHSIISLVPDLIKTPWNAEADQVSMHVFNCSLGVSFSLKARTGRTLELLTRHPTKTISWVDIYKAWSGEETADIKLKDKIYHHIKTLNKQIAIKTGMSELILYQAGEVIFNNLYPHDVELIRPD